MNLSDQSGDDSSSDEYTQPAKRKRIDTYGASSTTSQGSEIREESEDEVPVANVGNNNIRLSRSSVSENCSSPNERFDDYRPGFEEHDSDNGEKSSHPSFLQDSNDPFYSKKSFNQNEGNDHHSTDFSISGQMPSHVGYNKDGSQDDENESSRTDYSAISKKIMDKMGYKSGKGLGKFEHGRVDPVEASTQKGRRGLGSMPSVVGEVPKDFKWSPEDDIETDVNEVPVWIPLNQDEPLSGDVLDTWLRKGPKKLTIEDETLFVEPHILKGVIDAKTMMDTLDDKDLRHARFRSNPYETIGAVIFLNRAAVKMANIDAVFDFMFTNAEKPTGSNVDKKILYFADVCAGPGGFSEYILYKKGWHAKGFGFTLKGSCDFKLSNFYAGPPDTFDPYYGVKGDGNVFDPENLTSLKDYVLKQTDDQGVHFLMADGGFSVEGQENIQEILSKQLYLCQCLAAIMLVRTGGHFVVKLFDVFTLFSVGLLYIMYKCFDQVCIHKPVTSRPANSERYLICKSKILGTEAVERHLYNVNRLLFEGLDQEDVTELVPLEVIQEDRKFFDYIFNSNCMFGVKQIKSLLKIAAFSKDKSLKLENQSTIREQCLKLWRLPDEVRKQPEKQSPDAALQEMLPSLMQDTQCSLHIFKQNSLNISPRYIEKTPDLEIFKQVYDWNFVFLESGKNSNNLKLFLGCGGIHVYQLEGTEWKNVADLQITLPAKTLIYAEITRECNGEGFNQMFSKSLHIVDAMMLGGVNVSHLPFTERIYQCDLFCTALNKPNQALPIRCKRLFNLEKISSALEHLEYRSTKRIKKAVTLNIPNRSNRKEAYYIVGSLLFMRQIKEPWIAQISKKTNHKYYYNTRDGRSEYHIKPDACVDAVRAYVSRVQWPWEDAATAILENLTQNGISKAAIENFIVTKTGGYK